MRCLLDHIGATEITLVCQDWGGLTGLSVVKDAPHLFSNLVIMNTGLPAPVLDFQDDSGGREKTPLPIMAKIKGVRKRANYFFTSLLHQVLPFILWQTVVLLFGTHLPLHRIFTFALNRTQPNT